MVGIGVERREFQVKRDFRLADDAPGTQERMDRNRGIGAVQVAVMAERVVKIAQAGIERIDRLKVQNRGIGVTLEADAAAVADGEVLDDHILQSEIIGSLVKGVAAIGLEFAVVVIGQAHVSATCRLDAVTADGVHDDRERQVGRDVTLQVDVIGAGLGVLLLLDFLELAQYQVDGIHFLRNYRGGQHLAVAEGDEIVIGGLLGVAHH